MYSDAFSSRHFHCDAGSERVWFWEVSSETVSLYWAVLDGRQHGNDDTQHPIARSSLRLAHHAIPAGSYHHGKCLADFFKCSVQK